MKVVIRADAVPMSGSGHVMRCWALAEEFSQRGAEVEWHSRIDVPWVRTALVRQGWPVIAEEARGGLESAGIDADLAVVDSYDASHEYRRSLLDRGIPVVAIIDDFHETPGPASLWVNPGRERPIEALPRTRYLNGPRYLLIREEIRELRALRASLIKSGRGIDGVTFVLGGTDAAGIADMASMVASHVGIDGGVFVGPATASGTLPNILGAGPDLLKRAACSRLVVSTAGVASWEMLHVGVPVALIQAVENQRGNYQEMTARKWALPMGSASTLSDSVDLANRLMKQLVALSQGNSLQRAPIDGLGSARVVDAALAML